MKFFRRRTLPTKPPLVEPVKAGDPIVLDEEEQSAVDSRWALFAKDFKDTYYPATIADAVEKQLIVVWALREVARWRKMQGDYRGAASTCVKALGLGGDDPLVWNLLAEIHVKHGDLMRAKNMLDAAERAAKKPPWNRRDVGKQLRPLFQHVREAIRVGVAADVESQTGEGISYCPECGARPKPADRPVCDVCVTRRMHEH